MFSACYMKVFPIIVCISLYTAPMCAFKEEAKSFGKGLLSVFIGGVIGAWIGGSELENPAVKCAVFGAIAGGLIDHYYFRGKDDPHYIARLMGKGMALGPKISLVAGVVGTSRYIYEVGEKRKKYADLKAKLCIGELPPVTESAFNSDGTSVKNRAYPTVVYTATKQPSI